MRCDRSQKRFAGSPGSGQAADDPLFEDEGIGRVPAPRDALTFSS
jgi:hypothetical protein